MTGDWTLARILLTKRVVMLQRLARKQILGSKKDVMSGSAVQENETGVTGVTPTYQGLCSTCKNSATCDFPRTPTRLILECEEFGGYSDLKTEIDSPLETVDEEKLKGLCQSCENRHHCTYPKPISGVWHCDRYR